MLSHPYSFIAFIIAMNSIAYLAMCFDKYKSVKRGNRISENKLFALAFVFGALGIYLGMKAPVYHKSAKSKFKWGIPLMIVLNAICLYFLFRYFNT